MIRRKGIFLLIAILVLLAAAAISIPLKSFIWKVDSLETVRMGAATPIAALVYIADEQGFFKQRGINIAIKTYEAGSLAINGLLTDAVDIVTAAEFVMVQKSFGTESLRAFAQIANTNVTELVARKDHGIAKLSDLKGKKIGLPRGSVSEFFLGGYLRHNNMPYSSVEIVDLAPRDTEEELYNGSVDAIVIWEPHATRIKERLAENEISWPIQGRDDYYFLLITKEQFLRRSPTTAEKMLRALIDAEDFAGKHPEEAQRAVEARLNFRQGDTRLVLARSTLKVRLDQALLRLMEAEANWMIRNDLTSKREMPNYLDMIYLKGLEAVRPESVGIIH